MLKNFNIQKDQNYKLQTEGQADVLPNNNYRKSSRYKKNQRINSNWQKTTINQ